jgi:hypothetical protein
MDFSAFGASANRRWPFLFLERASETLAMAKPPEIG